MASSSRTNYTWKHRRSVVYKAASEKSQQTLEFFSKYQREEGTIPLNKHRDTLIHFLAVHGNVTALKMLLDDNLLPTEDLMKKNVNGDTVLHEAAKFGQTEFVKTIVKKERELVYARNNLGETPLYLAAAHGKEEVFTFLEEFKSDSDCVMRRKDGRNILHAAVEGECYRFAMTILELYPDLAQKRDEKGMTALHLLATQPSSFKSCSRFEFSNHGTVSFVPFQIIEVIIYSLIPPPYVESKANDCVEDPNDNRLIISESKRSYLTKVILGLAWIKCIDESKQKHILALLLAKRLVENEDWSFYLYRENIDSDGIPSKRHNRVTDPLIQATKLGIIELAKAILEIYPEAADTFDENGRNILQIVVAQKHQFLYYYLINNVTHRERLMSDVDLWGNTVMHLAAIKGTFRRVAPGPLQQLTGAVFWFKRITYDSYGRLRHRRNYDGKTAAELFEENQSDLQKEAEKVAREMASGIMIVAALIGTVNFAAIFTVPGGFDQTSGLPLLLKDDRVPLKLLMTYLGGALFASLFALGILLSIILSRFHIDDFYLMLPLKFIGISIALLFSAGYSVIAGCQAFLLEDALVCFGLIILGLVVSIIIIGIFYMDAAFILLDHMYDIIRYSLYYKSPKM